ncbi:double C2-like domain-containing protein, putative, partial [Hepatocystis sp. ex Piliocolobus tephrosceles]
MLDKFKNLVNLNSAGDKNKMSKTVPETENEKPPVPINRDNSNEKDEEAIFFDEMLRAPQYTYEEFIKILKIPQEQRGNTANLKKHWGYPRRWKVILSDLQIQNYMNSDFHAFVDFDFGGNREECRIQRASAIKIYAKGKTKNCFRTQVVPNVAAEQKKNINFRNVFEYKGSYLDLESEKLRIKVWKYKHYTLNKLEGVFEEPLLSFAVGHIYNETTLYKFIKDTRVKRCQLFFQLYFQELYDFELSFLNWSFSDLLSYQYIQAKSLTYLRNSNDNNNNNNNIKRYIQEPQLVLFFKNCKNSNSTSDKNKKKKLLQKKKNNINLDKINLNSSDESYDENEKNRFNNDKTDQKNDFKNINKKSTDKVTSDLKKLFHRNLSLMLNIDENEDSDSNLDNIQLPNPRITITLMHTPKINQGLGLVSMEQKHMKFSIWENLGHIYFSGTLKDLEVAYLNINVEDMSAPKGARNIGTCIVPLKGIVDYPYITHDLEAPPWVIEEAKYEGWYNKLTEWKFGSAEGRVAISCIPRYRQQGDIYYIDSKHTYLMVHILNVDQIITMENIKELDTYVEVSFDETSRRTKLIKKSLKPNYDTQLAIPLRFSNKNQMTYENFCNKGVIYIDVWGQTDEIVYIGGISVTPHEIFFTEKNIRRDTTKLEYIDSETNTKTNYETIVYHSSKKLIYLHEDQRPSMIHFNIWTYPGILDLQPNKLYKSPVVNSIQYLPIKLAKKYEKLTKLYREVLSTIKAIPEKLEDINKANRYLNYELLNQRKEYKFLPTLITNVKSPYYPESTNAIFHYIRCIPFIHKKENLAFTPDFTIQLKGGNALDHSLLLCSLFLGIPVISFVCFGTLWDNQKHVWVATLEHNEKKNYGFIKFWETTTGNIYILKKRFLDINRLKGLEMKINETKYKLHLRGDYLSRSYNKKINKNRIKEDTKEYINNLFQNRDTNIPTGGIPLPYKTIDLIFNNKNIYVNLQDPNPLNIWYDYWNIEYWFPFSSVEYNIKPCFTIYNFCHKTEDTELDKMAKELRSKIEKNINVFRASRNLSTRWNRDETLETFLQVGIELLHQLNTARTEDTLLAKVKIDDWKKALYQKVPPSHRLLGFPYHFNTCKSKFISNKLISTLAILESRDRTLCFSLAVCLYSLPGNFISTYIYIISCVKITQRELRKIEMNKEKVSIDTRTHIKSRKQLDDEKNDEKDDEIDEEK